MPHTLVLSGGGLDSFVAAASVLPSATEKVVLLTVDYRQKARWRELEANEHLKDALNRLYGPNHSSVMRIDFPFYRDYLQSPLTDNGTVITNVKAPPGVATEWVPARNTVLLSLGLAIAESEKFERIVVGINKSAATAYPDNGADWYFTVAELMKYAVSKETGLIHFYAPLLLQSKREIALAGLQAGLTLDELASSWSCYDAKARQCGQCNSCRSRKEAFEQAEVEDRTEYET